MPASHTTFVGLARPGQDAAPDAGQHHDEVPPFGHSAPSPFG
ncbi:MAG: hypothetical protein ACRDTE_34200 [Pseudonocardiaceae bacterium]